MRIWTFIFSIFFVSTLTAQDCLPGWSHYRELTLDYTASADSLFDAPVAIIVNTAELLNDGKIQPNLADLRLTDGNCNPLPFYPDSNATSTSNQIWTKLPVLPAGESQTIRMYYGNPNAEPAWNGDDVFVFFDDFSQDSVNLAKWETVGAFDKFRVNAGNLEYSTFRDTASNSRFKFARSTMSFTEPVWMDFRIEQNNASEFGFSSADSLIERYMLRYRLPGDSIKILAILDDTLDNGYAVVTDYPSIWIPRNQMQRIRLKASINANNKFYFSEIHNFDNGQFNDTPFEFPWFDMSGFHFLLTTFAQSFTVRLDYFRVWYDRETEPLSSVGDEIANPIFVSLDPERAISWNVFPNPTSGQLQIQLNDPNAVSSWRLFDMHGRLTTSWNASMRHLNLGNIPAGIYMLAAFKDEQLVGRKRVVLLQE
ncbi:MAG: DUF2341 domain-containing protein [Bacteroidota bacterium]